MTVETYFGFQSPVDLRGPARHNFEHLWLLVVELPLDGIYVH